MTYLMAVDQASSSGVAIFDHLTGDLIDVFTLKTDKRDTWGKRANELVEQLLEVAGEHLHHVSVIVFEKNHRTSVLVQSLPIAFAMACPQAKIDDTTGITPTEWKAYVKRKVDMSRFHNKGIDAINALKPGWIEAYDIDSDDAADAILIGLAYMDKHKAKKAKGKKQRRGPRL